MGGDLGITGFDRSFRRRWFFLLVGFDGKGLEMEESMILGFLCGGGKGLVDGGRRVAHCAPTMDEEKVAYCTASSLQWRRSFNVRLLVRSNVHLGWTDRHWL